jgi:hypothetical protein
MNASQRIVVLGMSLLFALPAAAQNVGVLQSAETMDRGYYKLMVSPIGNFGKNGADDEFGGVVRGGYGFTDHFDAEAKVGWFEDHVFLGADGEVWLLKDALADAGLAFSLTGGVHYLFAKHDLLDAIGLEITPQISGHITKDLELCGALAVSFESLQDAPAGVDDKITQVHLVPAVEYRVANSIDLVGEVGFGVNDDSSTYLGLGLAFYMH